MTKLLALLAVALLSDASAAVPPIPFTTVSEGAHSNIDDARDVVVRTAAEWKTLWTQHSPEQAMPAVDFAKFTVVGVFLGSRNTAGYRAVVTAVDKDKEGPDVIVTWHEERPGAGSIVSQVLTSPYHLVRIARTADPVKFKKADVKAP